MAKGWLKRGSKKNRFDWEDYDYLVGKGKTNTQIMERLWDNRKRLRSKDRQGRDGIFDRIQRRAQLDWKASTGWDSASGVDDWNFGLWGDKSFGKKDIRAARAGGDGASKYQIGQLYARAEKEGVKIDEWAQNWRKNVPESDYDYGKLGGWGFDKADAESFGDNWQGMKKAHDWALKNDVYIDHETVNPIMDRLRANQPVDKPDLPGWDPVKPPPPLDDINKDIKEPVPVGSVPSLDDINKGMKEPTPSPGLSRTYTSVAGKGGYSGGGGAGLKISRTNTNTMKRKTWNSSSVNV